MAHKHRTAIRSTPKNAGTARNAHGGKQNHAVRGCFDDPECGGGGVEILRLVDNAQQNPPINFDWLGRLMT